MAMHASHAWAMHACDETVVGLITENDESAWWKDVKNFVVRGMKKTISPSISGRGGADC